jgi:phenylalanyl-tRNA synthetase beta chain
LASSARNCRQAQDGKLFRIGVGKLRGVESQGMLCSARELKLSEDHGGLLELAQMRPWARTCVPAAAGRHVFTLKLTPNLGHCLSVTASRAKFLR